MSLDINSEDVVRLVGQFLSENSLSSTLAELQRESQVSLNTVDDKSTLIEDIERGRWDIVLKSMERVTLPVEKLFAFYEHIILELLQLKEVAVVQDLVQSPLLMRLLKEEEMTEKAMRLQKMFKSVAQTSFFDEKEAFPRGRDVHRREMSKMIDESVFTVPPGRLLALLGQALKWQQHSGLLSEGERFDLFQGQFSKVKEDSDKAATICVHNIKFGKKAGPASVCFAPFGQGLVSGSSDGFVEVWDTSSGKIDQSLAFQREENFMIMDDAVLSLGFSVDHQYLATGSRKGSAKVWKFRTGDAIARFKDVHSKGITSIRFSRDNLQLLTASLDGTARILGLRSRKTLKVFEGHESVVNDAIFNADGTRVVTSSSDGHVKAWDARTTQCLFTISPPAPGAVSSPAVNQACRVPSELPLNIPLTHGVATEAYVICNRSPILSLMTLDGRTIVSYSMEASDADFLCIALARKGTLLYAGDTAGNVHCFSTVSGSCEKSFKAHDKEVLAISHHPLLNLIATISTDGRMKTWKSQ